MTNEQKKVVYEKNPNEWLFYVHYKNKWSIYNSPDFEAGFEYQLIKIEDEAIADAVIANPNVEVAQFATLHRKDGISKVLDFTLRGVEFFRNYEANAQYQLVEG